MAKNNMEAMKIQNRRLFVQSFAIGSIGIPSGLDLWGKDKNNPNRFQIGIQEYTFNRLLRSGKLKHLDYPAMVKKELGIEHVEYWSRPFEGKHTDKKFVGELKKRTNGEGISNVLILVDEKHELDDEKKSERDLSVDLHKGWIDCAAQLGCSAIRVNCRKGGDPQDNLRRAVDGVGRLCEYAQNTPVKVVIEPHGRNSQDPDWLLAVMKELNHPHAGILPDFNNFGSFDRYSAVEKTLPYAPAVCAKALKFDQEGNETHTDYFKMLRIVHGSDFSGVISIEFEGHGVDPVAGTRMTKKLILNALEKARNT
jgi:sugar phosphate isomerase/epimerase